MRLLRYAGVLIALITVLTASCAFAIALLTVALLAWPLFLLAILAFAFLT